MLHNISNPLVLDDPYVEAGRGDNAGKLPKFSTVQFEGGVTQRALA